MPTLEIVNLSAEVYEQLEQLARVRGRSLSEQAAELLRNALSGSTDREAALLEQIRADRERLNVPYLTEADLQQMKRQGRE